MKFFSCVVILLAVLGALIFSNPKLEHYDQFLSQRITEASKSSAEPMVGVLGSLLGGFAASLVANQTVRKDYVLFSTYDTAFGNDHMRAIGILNNFFITEDPPTEQRK
jgi:hypothetical protein